MQTRWIGLTKHELALAMSEGRIREARASIKPKCSLCSKTIKGQDRYYDVDRQRYAHEQCVIDELRPVKKQVPVIESKKRVVTHTMQQAVQKAKEERVKTNIPQAEASSITSQLETALPGCEITLTIRGTAEAVQRALDRLQN